MKSFVEQSRELRVEIDQALDQYVNESDWPESLREAVRHSLLGPGKRLRPLLVLMAPEACGCRLGGDARRLCGRDGAHVFVDPR